MITKRKADLPTGMSSYNNNLKLTPSVNLNYKTEKLNLYWQSYLITQRRFPNNEFTTRLYDYEWHIYTTWVWYFLNKEYPSPMRKWGFHESEGTGFTNVILQHKYRFQQAGHELNSQILFTKGWEDETYNLSQDGPSPYPVIRTDKTRVLAPEYVYLISSDYTRPLPFGRLEAGISGKIRHMPITYTMTKDPENTALLYNFGEWSEWDENMTGAYVNMIAEFLKADIEAGLRGEYTNVTYKFAPNPYFIEDQYDYFSLSPNVRLTLKINKSNKLSVFFNRRIDRPGEDILRIFPKYDDPELLKIGNPSLRPQFTRNFELAHRYLWQKGSFYTSLYHKIIDDYFTIIYIRDPLHSEITIKAYDNLGRATNSGLEFTFDQMILTVASITAS